MAEREPDVCARCGEDGEDRRTLWMACLYAMSELPIPFEEVAIMGRFCRKTATLKPFNTSQFSAPDGEERLRPFFTLRVCKRCRADWMGAIQAWFETKPVDKGDDENHEVYIRDKGHSRLATALEIERMKVERDLAPTMTLGSFAEINDLEMIVSERDLTRVTRDLPRFYAYFKNVEVKGDGILVAAYGNGSTELEAIRDYAKEISGRTLVVHAFHVVKRRELKAPRFTQI